MSPPTIMLPTIIELLCKIIVSRVPLFIFICFCDDAIHTHPWNHWIGCNKIYHGMLISHSHWIMHVTRYEWCCGGKQPSAPMSATSTEKTKKKRFWLSCLDDCGPICVSSVIGGSPPIKNSRENHLSWTTRTSNRIKAPGSGALQARNSETNIECETAAKNYKKNWQFYFHDRMNHVVRNKRQ